MTEQFLSNMI